MLKLLQRSIMLVLSITKLVREFLLSAFPISFENNAGPKRVILSRYIKNSILQILYKIINTTGWSVLQCTWILRIQDFKSCNPLSS